MNDHLFPLHSDEPGKCSENWMLYQVRGSETETTRRITLSASSHVVCPWTICPAPIASHPGHAALLRARTNYTLATSTMP